jgi:hypothetical protein
MASILLSVINLYLSFTIVLFYVHLTTTFSFMVVFRTVNFINIASHITHARAHTHKGILNQNV